MLKRFVASIVTLALTSGTLTAQAGGSAQRVRLTVSGRQTSGRLIAVDAEAVTIVPDGKRDPIRIALSSVSTAELSAGGRRRAAILSGIGAGAAAGIGSFIIAAKGTSRAGQGVFCDRCLRNGILAALGVGIFSGVFTAYAVDRERWRPVPVASLASPAPSESIRR